MTNYWLFKCVEKNIEILPNNIRLRKLKKNKNIYGPSSLQTNISSEDNASEFSENEDLNTNRPHRCTKTGTTAFIPENILSSPKLVSLSTRMKIAPAQQYAFTKALIEESEVTQIK